MAELNNHACVPRAQALGIDLQDQEVTEIRDILLVLIIAAEHYSLQVCSSIICVLYHTILGRHMLACACLHSAAQRGVQRGAGSARWPLEAGV